ncbi:MAG: TonB-dependent receptor [Lewinella sp.]|nr:TonB-dependent receptor [Lewinella sp.]
MKVQGLFIDGKRIILGGAIWACLLGPMLVFGQSGLIQGRVIDAETAEPLYRASVVIESEFSGVSTDIDGHFRFTDLPAGNYYLQVRYLGYQSQIRLAVIEQDEAVTVDFGLIPLAASLTEVVISAPETNLLDEPIPSTKISSGQIERLAATNTAEILEEVGGVSVGRAGNWGSKPYFQGMTDSRVLLFIDGIKTTQSCPMGMDACTATIEPDMINSMDVQVGPGNAQFGSGNMGGIVSINTIGAQYQYLEEFRVEMEAVARVRSVSDSRSGLLAFKGGNKALDFALSAGGGRHGNYKVPDPNRYTLFPNTEIPNSGFDSRWLHLHTRYRPGAGQEIALIGQIYRGENIGWPARMPETYSIIPEEKRDLLAIKYRWEFDGRNFKKLEAVLGYQPMFHNMLNYVPGNTRFFGISRTGNYQSSVKAFFALGERSLLTAGIDGFVWKMNAERQTITEQGTTPFVNILNRGILQEGGIFLLHRYLFGDRLTIDAGLRLNAVSSDARPDATGFLAGDLRDNQKIWTGNLTALYQLNRHMAVSVGVVKGFNAATPVDRFLSAPQLDGFYHFGNPEIRPEVNVSKTISWRGMKDKWSWNLTYFHNRLRDLIERRIDTTQTAPITGLRGVKRAVNIPNAVVKGASAYLAYYITPALQSSLTISYLNGRDGQGGNLPNIAPLEFSPKITFEPPEKNLWVSLRADIATGQDRFAPNYGEISTPAYTVFDLSGGGKVTEQVELSLGISNLSNRNYRRHLNLAQLPEPGLSIFATVKVNLPVIGAPNGAPGLKGARLVTIRIEGMACQFCAKTVRERSEALPQVIQAIIHLEDGKAAIIVSRKASLEAVLEAIRRAGFGAQILSVEDYTP